MAKKPQRRRRRRFNLRKVRYSSELALSTLDTDTALTAAVFGAADGAYRMMSLHGTWSLVAPTANEGPITVGWAHSDYSVAEIKECLEAVASISQGLKIEQERSNRLVRIVGTFPPGDHSVLNNGLPIATKLNWLIAVGDSVVMFAFNEDTSGLTTGMVVNMQGNAFVKDVT